MNKKIEHPKVFISYSWSSKDYEDKVMNFAVRLQKDGVEVLIDKWIMKPGNDTIDFMEKCVKDPEVNFVLMLLDKKYKEKADKRTGGVGIETQIISNQVYNDVEQSKFIPIIFDRDESGKIFKPIYLNTRFYYDLTQNNFEEEYVKLVKQIYGREIYYKPELGNKPKWVDENINNPSELKFNIMQPKEDFNLFEELIKEIKKSDLNMNIAEAKEKIDICKNNLKTYNNSLKYRDALIEIFLRMYGKESFINDTCDFYEKLKEWNEKNQGILKEIWKAFIHETFIYLIAVLLKNKQFAEVNTFITKSYFQNSTSYDNNIVNSNDYFYSNEYEDIFSAKKELDNKKYFSPIAQLWIENIYEPKINKEEFTLADLLIYNLSIILLDKKRWYWFPITYIYAGSNGFNSSLRNFSVRLKSKYELKRLFDLFKHYSIEEVKELFIKMQTFIDENKGSYGYNLAFESADLITDYIKIDEIGCLN